MDMDIDRFFSGPRSVLQSNSVFTNREKYVAKFLAHARDHVSQTWTNEALMDFHRPAQNILVIVGEGGLGKSTLARRIASLVTTGEFENLPSNSAVAIVDFADMEMRSAEIVLLRVRAAFSGLARSFPAFDMALALYWERKHPGESLSAFVRKSSRLGSVAVNIRVADQMIAAMDTIASGGLGLVGLGRTAAMTAGQAAARAKALHRLRRFPAFDALLQTADPDRMLGYLPILLSYDIERRRARCPTLPLCLLDTMENVQTHPVEHGGLEDLLCRLVYLMPNVLFVGTSRRALRWHDLSYGLELTYGGAERWPGLARIQESDQLYLEALEPHYADEYLRARLTVSGEPAIPPTVRDRIIAGSDGSPLYLQLSADLFDEILAKGVIPEQNTFGRPLPQLVTRIMRDLDATSRDLLRGAALFRAFDQKLLAAAVPTARGSEIDDFCARSFVQCDLSVWPPFRLHDSLRECVTECDRHTKDAWTDDERERAVRDAAQYVEASSLNIWNDDADPTTDMNGKLISGFLLSLHAAADHNIRLPGLPYMAHALHELGYRQVLATLPDPEPSASSELLSLVETARISASSDADVRPLYARLTRILDETVDGPYSAFAKVQLGLLAFMVGDLTVAASQFQRLADDREPIGSSARLGLAGCAQRQSRFADHATHAASLSARPLDPMPRSLS